jgi:putative membrane protein
MKIRRIRRRAMKILIRVLVTAAALAVAARVVPGIHTERWSLHGTGAVSDGASIAVTLIVVAVIFSIVNVTIKPVIKKIGCVFYFLTFGLVALVDNGALLDLTSYIAYDKLHLPFHITTSLAAIEGALIVGLASELTNRVLDNWGSSGGPSSGGSSSGADYYPPGGYYPGDHHPGDHHPR